LSATAVTWSLVSDLVLTRYVPTPPPTFSTTGSPLMPADFTVSETSVTVVAFFGLKLEDTAAGEVDAEVEAVEQQADQADRDETRRR